VIIGDETESIFRVKNRMTIKTKITTEARAREKKRKGREIRIM